MSLVQLDNHLRIEESKGARVRKIQNNEAGTSSINKMEEGVNSKKRNWRRRFFNKNTYNESNKKRKNICWNCNKLVYLSRDCRAGKDKSNTIQNHLGKGSKDQGQGKISNFLSYSNLNHVSKMYEAFYVKDDKVS